MIERILLWALFASSAVFPATTGRVIDRAGQPVSGVAVSLDQQTLSTVTDALGRFTLGTTPILDSKSLKRTDFIKISETFAPNFKGNIGTEIFNAEGRKVGEIRGQDQMRTSLSALAKSAVLADTVAFSKTAFLSKRVRAGADTNVGDIVLYPAFSGVPTNFLGFNQFNFTVAGKPCLVVVPRKVRAGSPWIWRTYFWAHKPLFDSMMSERGYYLAFMDAPNLFGAPAAVSLLDSLYQHLTVNYGFSKKPVLVAISRGGLYAYNWALPNLGKVSCIYGDGAVMDFISWPLGGYGTGTGSAGDWTLLKSIYGFTSDAQARAYRGNPYQNMRPFAAARIPLINVYGTIDLVVPPPENCLKANDTLLANGWQMKLLAKPNTGHVHGLTAADGGLPGQLDTLVNFVFRNTSE